MKKKLLITGGLGFIGSHSISLLNDNYDIFVVDNLSNSRIEVIEKLSKITSLKVKYYNFDLVNELEVNNLFKQHNFDFIIHYAGFKSVSDSIVDPISYYHNNFLSTLNLLNAIRKDYPTRFIFSSSATVYGPQKSPVKESMSFKSLNPYASTKIMNEQLLLDYANSNKLFSLIILRYFNPVGAHPSGLIGENPKGNPTNLMPIINKVAKGEIKSIPIFGKDYNTNDGTCLRDFIHIMDLAEVHLLALEQKFMKNINMLNVGTGNPTSVLEAVKAFQEVNKIQIPYKFLDRRIGDIESSYADCSEIKKILNWKPKFTIFDMCKDAWNFYRQ